MEFIVIFFNIKMDLWLAYTNLKEDFLCKLLEDSMMIDFLIHNT